MTSHATFLFDSFFFLLQSEYGDLYKVTMDCTEQTVHSIAVQYFDTVPPGSTINILTSGFLFLGAEHSNHAVFQFKSTGEDEENPKICASQQSDEFDKDTALVPRFNSRKPLNLQAKDEMQNLAPIHDMKVEDLTNEGTSQMYLACGRGAQGTIRALRQGLTVLEMAVSQMPGRPLSVITMKGSLQD